MVRHALFIFALTALGGHCVRAPDLQVEGKYTCEDTAGCPVGWACHDGVCVSVAPPPPCDPADCDDDDPCTADTCVNNACAHFTTSTCGYRDAQWIFAWAGLEVLNNVAQTLGFSTGFERITVDSQGDNETFALNGYATDDDAQLIADWTPTLSAQIGTWAGDEVVCTAVGTPWERPWESEDEPERWNPDDLGVVCRQEHESGRFWRGHMSVDSTAVALASEGHLAMMLRLPTDATSELLAGTWHVIGVESARHIKDAVTDNIPTSIQLPTIRGPQGGWFGTVVFTSQDGRACLDESATELRADEAFRSAPAFDRWVDAPLIGCVRVESDPACIPVSAEGAFVLPHTETDAPGQEDGACSENVTNVHFSRDVTWIGWVSEGGRIALISVFQDGPGSDSATHAVDWDAEGPAHDALLVLVRADDGPFDPGLWDGRWVLASETRDPDWYEVAASSVGWVELDPEQTIWGPGWLQTTTFGLSPVDADNNVRYAEIGVGEFVTGEPGVLGPASWADGPLLRGYAWRGEGADHASGFIGYHADSAGDLHTPSLYLGTWAGPRGGWK